MVKCWATPSHRGPAPPLPSPAFLAGSPGAARVCHGAAVPLPLPALRRLVSPPLPFAFFLFPSPPSSSRAAAGLNRGGKAGGCPEGAGRAAEPLPAISAPEAAAAGRAALGLLALLPEGNGSREARVKV